MSAGRIQTSLSNNLRLALLPLFFLMCHSANSVAAESFSMPPPEPYCQWQVNNFAIDQSLCGLTGNAVRGKEIVSSSNKGNCVACHELPIEGIEAYGTIGPALTGIGARLPKGLIRLRVVDTRKINPLSIMPGYYRDPALIHRPAKAMAGRTFLTAQQVEDVVAYLETLK